MNLFLVTTCWIYKKHEIKILRYVSNTGILTHLNFKLCRKDKNLTSLSHPCKRSFYSKFFIILKKLMKNISHQDKLCELYKCRKMLKNSIQCTKCQGWVHRRCSDVLRQVSLLSCRDVFACKTCFSYNCSVEEKLEFKRGEDVLKEVGKFCYLDNTVSCYVGASEAASARIRSAWKKFSQFSGVLV